jgi:hypothetical protein
MRERSSPNNIKTSKGNETHGDIDRMGQEKCIQNFGPKPERNIPLGRATHNNSWWTILKKWNAIIQ